MKLTAEQVREAVMSADRWEKPMGNTGLTNTHLIIRDDGWQAIADELNSQAERTCEAVGFDDGMDEGIDGEWHSYDEPKWDLSCGHSAYGVEPPNFCPNCGRKVVDA